MKKGTLYQLDNGWHVKYTTYKTIPGRKGVMGSHSRIPESVYILLHRDCIASLTEEDERAVVDFEIEYYAPSDLEPTMGETISFEAIKYARIISKRNKKERAVTQWVVDEAMKQVSPQVRAPKCVREGEVKRTYTEEELYSFGKLVLSTFHSEGKIGEKRLPRIKFDEWFNKFKNNL